MTTRMSYALAVGLMFSGMARGAETLEEVEKKIAAEADKLKTLSAKMITTSETESSGMSTKLKMEATSESAWRGEKVLLRVESKTTMIMKMGDEPEKKTESKSLSVADGEYMYVLNDQEGEKTAMKMKQDPKTNVKAKEGFELLRKEYDLKLLDDEKINGKAVYVIEAKPKKPEPDTTTQIKFYYTKEGGLMVKSTTSSKSPQMKMSTTLELTDVKLNADIKPERFVFKAPEGVKVQDMSKLSDTQPAEAKPADDKPANEAKEEPKEEKKAEEKKADPPPAKEKDSKKPKLPKLPGLGK
jgi:outer membrane lipoprotein-sorting protein